MDANQVIDALGGTGAVSQLTGALPGTVSGWRNRGIAARYWHILVDAARARGLPGITFETLAATKPCRDAAP